MFWSNKKPASSARGVNMAPERARCLRRRARWVVWGVVGLSALGPAVAGVLEHSGAIGAQTTWAADGIHRITGTLTINAGVRLTIEPGTVVRFDSGARINVNGVLDAQGTAGARILFTSYRDDSAGGDTNGDGASAGQAGDWSRIHFSDSVIDSQTRLSQVEVRYGGSTNEGALYVYRADIEILDSLVPNARNGLYIRGRALTRDLRLWVQQGGSEELNSYPVGRRWRR